MLAVAESTREFPRSLLPKKEKHYVLMRAASRSNGRERQTTGGSGGIPQDAFDAMGIDSPRPGGGDGGGDVGGERICPHCTFVNEGSGSDCEICGLPLSG